MRDLTSSEYLQSDHHLGGSWRRPVQYSDILLSSLHCNVMNALRTRLKSDSAEPELCLTFMGNLCESILQQGWLN